MISFCNLVCVYVVVHKICEKSFSWIGWMDDSWLWDDAAM